MNSGRLRAACFALVFACCAAVAAAGPASDLKSGAIALEEATITQLQIEMAAGRLTSSQLVEFFLRRIESLDRDGPQLNAIIEINPDALDIAGKLDVERHASGPRGPLHGIPVLIKDNIDTADGMLTTAGSLALVSSKPRRDAFIVRRLRDAGAVILGKTNLSEWANLRSSRSSSGWSGRGGQTRNPYDLNRNPCGSSSGSGAAIAAGLAVVAVGTETDGSIVCPGATNGIVGIKPTVGLVSRNGIIPISASQDTAGPMAKTVQDAAILLSVLAATDSGDAATQASREHVLPSFATPPASDSLRGARIGVARNLAGFHEGVDAIFEEAIKSLADAGAVIVDHTDLKVADSVRDDELAVMFYEFKDGINRYLSTRTEGPRTLAELIAFNERESAREMPYFGQEEFLKAEAKGPLTDRAYVEARRRSLRAAGVDGIDAVLKKYRLDAIIAPTGGAAWTTDLVNGDHFVGGDVSTAPAIAGYPHITVPAGYLHGLPIGLSFVGSAWSDSKLIRLSYAFEQATRARHPPVFAGPASRAN